MIRVIHAQSRFRSNREGNHGLICQNSIIALPNHFDNLADPKVLIPLRTLAFEYQHGRRFARMGKQRRGEFLRAVRQNNRTAGILGLLGKAHMMSKGPGKTRNRSARFFLNLFAYLSQKTLLSTPGPGSADHK
ncbi:hypothetical protein [Ruegeria sp.]|uniref:hypothetical protein n=1 Tax=Ruegeria sp. TaxID=1879320 RepID=UPI003B58EA97